MITAQAVFRGQITGFVNFTQEDEGGPVNVCIYIHGLSDGEHGIHIHSGEGECCSDLGGHFCILPGIAHGSYANNTTRHTGDLCNNVTSENNVARYQYTDHLVSLIPGDPANIANLYVVVHEDRDDGGDFAQYTDQTKRDMSRITGNAGKRLACAQVKYVI